MFLWLDIGKNYGDASTALFCCRCPDRELQPGSTRVPRSSTLPQSAIIKLEEEVGERLFERTQRKALLTAAGSLLLPHTASILEAARLGQQEIREMGG